MTGWQVMHLLKIDESGALYDSDEAVDLGQPAGDVVILTSADTEVSLLARAAADSDIWKDQIRIANYLSLTHPYSVDLYIENTARHAKIVIIRLLGGVSYWSYGVQQLRALAETSAVKVVFLSGDGKADPELTYLSSVDATNSMALSAYLDAGGIDNAHGFLGKIADLLNDSDHAPPVRPLMRAGLYWPGLIGVDFDQIRRQWHDGAPVAALVFYRALMQAGDVAPIDCLIDALRAKGMNPLPLFGASLKETETAAIIADFLVRADVDVILNMTSFAVSDPSKMAGAAPGDDQDIMRSVGPFGAVDAPVFQLILASNQQADWQTSTAGLTARDLAMNVALPELDGRILTRAIGFKQPLTKDPVTHAMTTSYVAADDRAAFVADLVGRWCRLRYLPNAVKKIGFVLANYPNKDGRIANGVGLDTPQSVLDSLVSLQAAGYDFPDLPGFERRFYCRITQRANQCRLAWPVMPCAFGQRYLYSVLQNPARSDASGHFRSVGGQSMMIRCLMAQAFACQSCCLAMPPLGCSQRVDIISIPKRPITLPIWCRRIIISGFIYGFVMCGAWMQRCITANMAIWNGFPARRWH